jgi:DNA-binding transcriptional LysR family regulator
MSLTEAGNYLMPKAEHVLRSMRELEDGLSEYGGGTRATIRLAGINSVLRVILPLAMRDMRERFPAIDFDIHENAPADILELLYGRRVNIGLVAANSIAEAGVGFLQIPVVDDPYVLVVPEHLDLSQVENVQSDLDAKGRAILNQSIQFIFGTQHAKRVEAWYDQMLPDHRISAQCRSFEVAIGLVRAGLGVCLAPALSAVAGNNAFDGVKLYQVHVPPRRIVALVPSQYRRIEPYASLIDGLQKVGQEFVMPAILPTPPFLNRPSLAEL